MKTSREVRLAEHTAQPNGDEALRRLHDQLLTESSDAIKLVADPCDNPICSIIVDESIPAIILTWRAYATSTQFRFVQEHLLRMIRERGACKLLADDTSLPTIHHADQDWLVCDWVPRAVAAGLRVAAVKRSASHFGRVAVDAIHGQLPEGFEVRSFDDTVSARAWLTER